MKCNPLTQDLCLWVLQNSGRGGEIEQMNRLISSRLIFMSLLLHWCSQPEYPHWSHPISDMGYCSWTHSNMLKPSWNALALLQSSILCPACIHQHKDISRLLKQAQWGIWATLRAKSYRPQLTSVEALYAEMDVETLNATTWSFKDLAESKVDT